MASRSSELWWREHWGPPCKIHNPVWVDIAGKRLRTDGRMADAWRAFSVVLERHGYGARTADTGMFNCRHIGNDPARPWSVHAWAGALDLNWQTNPDGNRVVTDMPQECRDDLLALRTRTGLPLFRWGGDWDRDPRTGHSYYDAMHWEIIVTPAELLDGVIDPTLIANTPEDDMLSVIIPIYDRHNIDWTGDPGGVEFWERHAAKVGVKQLIVDMLGAIHAAAKKS